MRVFGLIKLAAVLAVDGICIYCFTSSAEAAVLCVLCVGLYSLIGGFLTIIKEQAVHISQLPQLQKNKLEEAGRMLAEDIKKVSNIKTNFKLFVIPDNDNTLNATAYGGNCISVTQGTLKSADTVTLAGVIAHEASHILNMDAEFYRAIFASVLGIVLIISMCSYLTFALIFLMFMVFGLKSLLSIMLFRGTTKLTKGMFKAIQLGMIAVYKFVASILSQQAEYRCDAFACELGYGQNLACFLEKIESGSLKKLTLADVLYRTHPPTEKRIAKIERRIYSESLMVQ